MELTLSKVLLAIETVYGETEVIQHKLYHAGKVPVAHVYLVTSGIMF